MKHLNKLAFMALATCAVMSCSKKKEPAPSNNNTNPPAAAQVDTSKLESGDWHGVSAYTLYYDGSGNITSADGASKTYHEHGVAWVDSFEEKFTFHADNTYDHVRLDGVTGGFDLFSIFMPVHGTWQLRDDNKTLRLSFIGGPLGDSLSDFKVEAFNDNYMHLTFYDSLRPTKQIFHLEFTK